ncbi:tyrosine-type recombinase/integrase [Pseudomonas sp. 2FG]|uniref:tyrosine-type recombinase/integrase n=1 Tax=Pseudomonas sp. 2FG TaxID=2502191 RepID=UPI0010F98E61|nr:tyrosine-type recombinase/integrase [Pseudomonas sp. 2FG]
MNELGTVVRSFFEDHLKVQKGLRPSSIRSYRDVLKLFLKQISDRRQCPITRLKLTDLVADEVLAFLRSLEAQRGNQVRTRNQRLAALRTFFRYLASRAPEMLAEAARVEAIPTKRCPPPPTYYLERDEVDQLLAAISTTATGLRDRAILTLMYNTGARVQEIADLRVQDIDLDGPHRVRLHGKGDKWRACPIWPETAQLLKQLESVHEGKPDAPLFYSRLHAPLTRFGLYKLVKRYAANLPQASPNSGEARRISPHVFRHTAAMHLLEAGVEINVIRAWLGHVSLETTNRYAEINIRTKEAAVALCAPPDQSSAASSQAGAWHRDVDLLKWLNSL